MLSSIFLRFFVIFALVSCGKKQNSELPILTLEFSETDHAQLSSGTQVYGVLKITPVEDATLESAVFIYTTDGTEPDPSAQNKSTVLSFDLSKDLDSTGANPTYRTSLAMRIDANTTVKALAVAKVIQKQSEKTNSGQEKNSEEEVSVNTEMASATYTIKSSSSPSASPSSTSSPSSTPTPVRNCNVAFKSNASYDSGLTMYSQRNMAAENFTVTATTYVKNISFPLAKTSTDPLPATVNFGVRADNAGSPDFAALATVSVDVSTLPTTWTTTNAAFASELSLPPGTYWVVVECPTCGGIAAGQTHISIQSAMISNLDPNGIYKERLASTAWQTGSVYDMSYDIRQCLTQ